MRARADHKTCTACGEEHLDPSAWIEPLRRGDARRALEALVGQWLGPIALPLLTHRNLPEILDCLGPRIEPVLCHNHLWPPRAEGLNSWWFAFENQSLWKASVNTSDMVLIDDADATTAMMPLGEFLLDFVLFELAVGLPRGAQVDMGKLHFPDFSTVAVWPLPHWRVFPDDYGDVFLGAAEGVLVAFMGASARVVDYPWATFVDVGGRCPRAVGRVVEQFEAIREGRPPKRSRRAFLRRHRISDRPWYAR